MDAIQIFQTAGAAAALNLLAVLIRKFVRFPRPRIMSENTPTPHPEAVNGKTLEEDNKWIALRNSHMRLEQRVADLELSQESNFRKIENSVLDISRAVMRLEARHSRIEGTD
jgi:hypothetical protein